VSFDLVLEEKVCEASLSIMGRHLLPKSGGEIRKLIIRMAAMDCAFA
jgi:hypothetical protein